MENLSFEIDLLSSDTLAHVNTIIELDYERPDIALLAIRRGAGIRRRCNKVYRELGQLEAYPWKQPGWES